MQVIVSTTITIDGFLDDTSVNRLLLSSEEDTHDIHRLRARVGAILIGAQTLRKDNPLLNTRHAHIQPQIPPAKIIVTSSGDISPTARLFTDGEGKTIIFCGPATPAEKLDKLSKLALVVPCNERITAKLILQHLSATGITRLLVEGGATIQSMFFSEKCVDILRLGIAPLILGKHGVARFLSSSEVPLLKLATLSNQKLGNTSVTWYQVKNDIEYLQRLFAIGRASGTNDYDRTIILNKYGEEISGTSQELSPTNHATEAAVLKAHLLDIDIQGATVFASGEPCISRDSSLNSCCSLLIKNRVSRVVLFEKESNYTSKDRVDVELKNAGIEVCRYKVTDEEGK